MGLTDPYCYHRDDPTSVGQWVEELKHQVLHYKPQTESCIDFELVIFLDSQRDYLQNELKYPRNKITFAMDSTFGIGVGNFKLTTLLHFANTGDGIPVLFLISPSDDTTAVETMLKAFRDKIGEFHTDAFISDDARSFRNAWTNVMGPAEKYFLCTWHVKCAVNEKIGTLIEKEKDKKDLIEAFKILVDERDMETFYDYLEAFKLYLRSNGFNEFLAYFEKNYIMANDQSDRVKMWALCFRQELRLPTNNHIENYHKDLKHERLGGCLIKRVDKTIYALRELVKRRFRRKLNNLMRGRLNSRKKGFAARCDRSDDHEVVKIEEGKYKVTSKNGDPHVVTFVKDCDCLQFCSECKVCDHGYSCDCQDNEKNVCKHLHAVGKFVDTSFEQRFDEASVKREIQILDYHLTIEGKKKKERNLLPLVILVDKMFSNESEYTDDTYKEIDFMHKRLHAIQVGFEKKVNNKHFNPLLPISELKKNNVLINTPANKKVYINTRFRGPKMKKKRGKEIHSGAKKELMHNFLRNMPANGKPEIMEILTSNDNEHSYASNINEQS